MSIINTVKFVANHPLNQKRKMSSLLRFARWQIGSRLLSGYIVHDWINGSRFLVRAGETGLTGNIYCGVHEFSDMGFLLHFLRKEDTFVDVGANAGSYTILASAAIGARGFAFEPIPDTFHRLVENIRLNGVEARVVATNKGLGAQSGQLSFTRTDNTMNRVAVPAERCLELVTVDVTTLDLCLENELPTLIKIDVEGYEGPVLKGGVKTLGEESLCAVIVELNGGASRYGYSETDILDFMSTLGFVGCSYDPIRRELRTIDALSRGSANMLFVRNRRLVEERLQTAPKVRVNGQAF